MTIKRFSGPLLVILASLVPALLWLTSESAKTLSFRSASQILALVGASMFAINFILSARFKWLESLFSGINRAYIFHHLVGVAAFILLLFHPIVLGIFYLKFSLSAAFSALFPPLSELQTWFGTLALLGIIGVMITTLYMHLPFHIWKAIHKLMGVFLLIAMLHVLTISSTVTTNMALRAYMLTLIGMGVLSFLYRSVLARYLVRRYEYKVQSVTPIANITEVVLAPTSKGMDFEPGQFIFIKFKSTEMSLEEHPFSLTSLPQEAVLTFSAKTVGDYTEHLKNLIPNDIALIEGPFGRFSYKLAPRKKQIWIAGGIGVTPFISMAKAYQTDTGYEVDMFYVTNTVQDAYSKDLFEHLAATNPSFKLFFHFSLQSGRIDAKTISTLAQGVESKDIFICAPPAMMKALRSQFTHLGVSNSHIFTEEFSLT